EPRQPGVEQVMRIESRHPRLRGQHVAERVEPMNLHARGAIEREEGDAREDGGGAGCGTLAHRSRRNQYDDRIRLMFTVSAAAGAAMIAVRESATSRDR